ncbi:ABC transporter permease [Halobacterium yunchengense]|uniref:ABC transporter permease n=1 Tax=Halobacterium yunchengense TaxID=3108497 RepID=UPI00300930E6
MPSTEHDAPLFTRIDWDSQSTGARDVRPRTVAFAVAVLALLALYAYDSLYVDGAIVDTWDLSRMDWLFFVAVLLFARYVLVPAATSLDRSTDHVRAFLRRPAAVASFAWIAGFGVLGVLGPELIGMPRVDFYADYQPPVFTSTDAASVGGFECVGPGRDGVCHGTWQYPLGTTQQGENVVNVVMFGAHVALKLSLTAAMIMVVVATAVGTAAGYYGGLVDDVLMRYVDVQQTIPAVVVYIILATMYLGKGLFTLALVFGLLNWGGIARLVRSETLERKQAGYVRAARSAGASDVHVVRRHLVPNSTGTVAAALTRQIPLLVLVQVGLAYLSLSVVDMRSLGGILRQSLPPFGVGWWVSASITAFLVVTVVAFNVFGDAIRDVVDPQEVA